MTVYRDEKTRLISFPVGGIGSGSVGLAGNGAFVDWEIFNRPFKGSRNGFTHMMVRAEREDKILDVRVLQGDHRGSAIGGETVNIKRGNGGYGYGYGTYRGTMAGVPHFAECTFDGEYPFARLYFEDGHFPGKISLTAFNPFIPLNDRDSSMPAAFYEIEFENTAGEPLTYRAYFSLNNLLPYGTTKNEYFRDGRMRGIFMTSNRLCEDDLLYGNFCLATDTEEGDYQEYWYQADWFDSLQTFWNQVNEPGDLKNRTYNTDKRKQNPTDLDGDDMATLGTRIYLEPGEKKKVRFLMAWYFPNCENYWNPEKDKKVQTRWKNYYASLFKDAKACALYGLKEWNRLYDETKLFKDALYATSLPDVALEAVSANLSILKSATCMRLEDGSFYAFEGCGPTEGCCEGSCTHVWNYAYALPYLFPKLERSMRDLEYRYSQREDGSVAFRLMLPLGRERYNFRACVDGHMGGVIKVYREFKICGDIKWLQGKWEAVKKSIEFAWAATNEDLWDADKDGVLEGRQHHTLDMELFGPSAWLQGFYQAALKAGSEIAELLGHKEEAREWRSLFEKGKAWTDRYLFNGEYYEQRVDLSDKTLLEKYNAGKTLDGEDSMAAYWNEEAGEIKYQIGNGSSIDQVIGQWHANLAGLGDVFDRDKVKSALRAVYRYNFKHPIRNCFNAARIYCMNSESGTVVCAWPENAEMPKIPITYANEVFCGMEYQAASHMIQEGLTEEGIELVKAVRERFDGEHRNPWNEFECGSNYARSLASYALIPSVCGFTCNLYRGSLGFAPKMSRDDFCGFFSTDTGWGIYRQKAGRYAVELLYGELNVRELYLADCEASVITAWKNEEKLYAEMRGNAVFFKQEVLLKAGDILRIEE